MENHFRISCRTGCKVYKHRITVMRCILTRRAREFITLGFYFCIEIIPAVIFFFAEYTAFFKSFTLGNACFNMLSRLAVICADDHLYIGTVAAEHNIFFCEKVRCRYGNRAYFMKRVYRRPELIVSS